MTVDLNRVRNLAETARAKAETVRAQRDGRSWYRIENLANTDRAEIYLYDMIGDWGVTAQDFANDLRGVTARNIDLHISSEGGEVFDGLAIYETLRRHPAQVTAHVDGIAASSASFIAMAAHRIVMAPRARMMIHDAHGVTIGNARDMREMATLLDELSDTIADIYAERAGGTRAQWRAAMAAGEGGPDGTWYDAQSAVAAGLADEIAGQGQRPAEDRAPVIEDAPPAPTPWSPAALLDTIREIENPPVPVALPTGSDLLTLFDLS